MYKSLRTIIVIIMALTAAFVLFSGIGTLCVALGAEKFNSTVKLAEYKNLYLFFVILSSCAGCFIFYSIWTVLRRNPYAYKLSVISVLTALCVSSGRMITSKILRGKSIPIDMVVLATVMTLILLFIIRIPKIWNKIDFTSSKSRDNEISGGMACLALAVSTSTISMVVSNSHVMNNGFNYASVFNEIFFYASLVFAIVSCCLLIGRQRLRNIYSNVLSKYTEITKKRYEKYN